MVQIQSTSVVARPRRQPLFLLGFLLIIAGLAIYIVQFSLKQFVTPWYTPILATMGVLLMAISAAQRRGVLRIAGLFVFTGLCGFEWFFLLAGSRVPAYTGPAQAGKKMPSFTASLANGSPFTESDLEQGASTVLVFFRGRW